jgi:hypothetical protein
MILSTYEEDNKSANVCKQDGKYVVMYYKDNEYIRTRECNSEENAEIIAEDWVIGG